MLGQYPSPLLGVADVVAFTQKQSRVSCSAASDWPAPQTCRYETPLDLDVIKAEINTPEGKVLFLRAQVTQR